MERIEGMVSDARNNLFKVGDQYVKISSGEPPIVSDGDMVAVAGRFRSGIISPYACYNMTKQIVWHQSYLLSLLAGILIVACGVFIMTGSSVPLIVLGCITVLIGILMLSQGVAILMAIKIVSASRT